MWGVYRHMSLEFSHPLPVFYYPIYFPSLVPVALLVPLIVHETLRSM